jgi:hypothetical protein
MCIILTDIMDSGLYEERSKAANPSDMEYKQAWPMESLDISTEDISLVEKLPVPATFLPPSLYKWLKMSSLTNPVVVTRAALPRQPAVPTLGHG